ncbi:hypothetical protein Gotri_022825 [Gossypium trilobum]|uniref:RNase H type-1 domain-containing protein n=1 Tax=Gossypium trilobum TaxID=34281 RepID=A0A7J9DHV3_9ROSI|nr:hypothetical protein [Gossypium trilobum]
MPTNSRIASIRPNTNRSGLGDRLISGDFENCIDWLEASIGLLDKKAPIIPFSPACINWKKPKKGFVKVNVDATVLNGRMGYGVIARDKEGFVMGGCGGSKDVALTSEWAGSVAFEERVQLARSLNLQNVIFESDNASLIKRIKRSDRNISIMVQHVHETCRELKKFASVEVTWVRRSGQAGKGVEQTPIRCNNNSGFVLKENKIDLSTESWREQPTHLEQEEEERESEEEGEDDKEEGDDEMDFEEDS